MTDDNQTGLLETRANEYKSSNTGVKRPVQDVETSESKRQKIDYSDSTCQDVCKFVSSFAGVGEKEYADFMCTSLNLLLEFLKPPGENSNSLRTEIAMTAISTLCIVFSEHPHAGLSLRIFRLMCKWLCWMSEQVCLAFPSSISL